jgi:hypothetical protein
MTKPYHTVGLLILGMALLAHATSHPNRVFPSSIDIYINGTLIVDHPEPGFQRHTIPIYNRFLGSTGCYMACYSTGKGGYLLAKQKALLGLIRIAGRYSGSLCQASDHSSPSPTPFNALCQQIHHCQNAACWAEGDSQFWLYFIDKS